MSKESDALNAFLGACAENCLSGRNDEGDAAMNANTEATIGYMDIQQALERCMAAEPAIGKEYGLSRDASLLGDILGEMIWRRIDAVPLKVIEGEHLDALVRWNRVSIDNA